MGKEYTKVNEQHWKRKLLSNAFVNHWPSVRLIMWLNVWWKSGFNKPGTSQTLWVVIMCNLASSWGYKPHTERKGSVHPKHPTKEKTQKKLATEFLDSWRISIYGSRPAQLCRLYNGHLQSKNCLVCLHCLQWVAKRVPGLHLTRLVNERGRAPV